MIKGWIVPDWLKAAAVQWIAMKTKRGQADVCKGLRGNRADDVVLQCQVGQAAVCMAKRRKNIQLDSSQVVTGQVERFECKKAGKVGR